MSSAGSGDPSRVASRTAAVAGALFLMTAAFVLTKTGRDALYFQGRGLFDLPRAYVGIAILSLPTAGLMLAMMALAGARRVRVVAPLVVAILLALSHRAVSAGTGPLMTAFFMLVPLSFGVLFSLTWLMAAEFLAGAPRESAARAYGSIGASSIAGGTAGAAAAKLLAERFEPALLVVTGALVLGAAALAILAGQAAHPAPARPRAALAGIAPAPAALLGAARDPYALRLLLVAMSSALVGILIEFQFYLAAATSGQGARENAIFFAGAYLVLNGIALVVQVFIMPALQARVGIAGSLLVLPAALLGATAALLAGATGLVRATIRLAEGGLRSSIHRANWEQAYLPIAGSRRAMTKLLVDGAGARVAEGLAAMILLVWLRANASESLVGRDYRWMTVLLFGMVVVWVLSTRGLGRSLARISAPGAGEASFRPMMPIPDS